jgi:hypothetical protein
LYGAKKKPHDVQAWGEVMECLTKTKLKKNYSSPILSEDKHTKRFLNHTIYFIALSFNGGLFIFPHPPKGVWGYINTPSWYLEDINRTEP